MNLTFCVFVRIASGRQFLQISKTYVFLKNNMGLSIKNTWSADFCADRIDVITNFADITNVVIKRVNCNSHISGLPQPGKSFWKIITRSGKSQGIFCGCGQGNLEWTCKGWKKSGNLKIIGFGSFQKIYLLCEGESMYFSRAVLQSNLIPHLGLLKER